MRIATGIHLVASGSAGFDLSDPLDCNVWLADAGDGLVLFDAGAGRDVPALIEAIRADGLDPDQIRWILLTHGHADHSGGAAELKRIIPGARVGCGPKTAALLADGDERGISLDRARGRVYPQDYVWTPAPVDTVLNPGVPFGAAGITLIETPGHSDDHCAFLAELGGRKTLVSGDALFSGGRVFLQDIEDCSVPKTLASLRKLAALDFDTFLPGHGAFSLTLGHRHADAGLRLAEAGTPPPQLF